MATDIPYWRKSTGAEQRIASLIQFLESDAFQVRTFYLGQTGSDQFTASDRKAIAELSLDIDQRSSDQPPSSLINKIGWYTGATLNRFANRNQESAEDGIEANGPSSSLTLSDFRWPWAIHAFKESVSKFRPSTILVQYVKLAYLLDALTPADRQSIRCVVDTHDILHLRNERFRANGFPHWIDIDRQEESNAIQSFDIALAIQSDEAKTLRDMAPDVETIVCGHASFSLSPTRTSQNAKIGFESPPSPTDASDNGQSETSPLRVGYLGSLNASNESAIKKLLSSFGSQPDSIKGIQFVIAGAICDSLKSLDATNENTIFDNIADQVTLLGRVEALEEFYSNIDVAVNPVEFGTGLKIKNTEALSFGVPLITTTHGAEGLGLQSHGRIFACHSVENMIEEIKNFEVDRTTLAKAKRLAEDMSATTGTADQVYAAFKVALLRD